MATTIQSAIPLNDAQQAAAWLGSAFPQYKTSVRARKVVIIGVGLATGIGIVPKGPNQAKINWQFPSMGVQMLLTLGIVFSGILPGLLVFLFVWLSVKDDVQRIEREVTAALESGVAPQAGAGANAPPM